MSYLNFPRLDFFGKFKADPSTLNNTPDNFNPNNQFPPNEGEEVDKNIQLYWNPNGTAVFQMYCEVNKVSYADGSIATTSGDDSIIGQMLGSVNNDNLTSARVVDLDPMQQNVTEIWGLQVGIGSGDTKMLTGSFTPSAYSNAWVQVVNGRGDYAGSAFYQSILDIQDIKQGESLFLDSLRTDDGSLPKLSMCFTLRAYNSASNQYLVNQDAILEMYKHGIPFSVANKLIPIMKYNQGREGSSSIPGKIPTTSYFKKLLSNMLSKEEYSKYSEQLIAITLQKPYTPLTPYDFTYGQVFGSIGLHSPDEPDFLTPNRMLTPTAIAKTSPPIQVPTDMAAYKGYFAPCKLNYYDSADGTTSIWVTVNLGNSLPSTKPASKTESFVDVSTLGNLQLCCFPEGFDGCPMFLGEIAYQDNNFYTQSAGIADIPINESDVEIVENSPLAVVTVDDNGTIQDIVLKENPEGFYLRANQFVYRMNPGTEEGTLNPGTAQVEFYASQFGFPIEGIDIEVSMLSSLEAATYSNHTLGTGNTSGMVNMSVPRSAVLLDGIPDAPVTITTDECGIATLNIKSLNPGNPRGYMDGQIYFLRYGFAEESINNAYIQSPDDLISLQLYEENPAIEDITWANFVQPVLGQYAKIYPIMSFLKMGDEASVIKNAQMIKTQLLTSVEDGAYMPVTRDMSQSRLGLIVEWLDKVST